MHCFESEVMPLRLISIFLNYFTVFFFIKAGLSSRSDGPVAFAIWTGGLRDPDMLAPYAFTVRNRWNSLRIIRKISKKWPYWPRFLIFLKKKFWSHLRDQNVVHIPKRITIGSVVPEITQSFSQSFSQWARKPCIYSRMTQELPLLVKLSP